MGRPAVGARLWVTGWSSKDVVALEPYDETTRATGRLGRTVSGLTPAWNPVP
jgi:hypothetical protein